MVSLDQVEASPRISFSAEFLDDNNNFISITPHPPPPPPPISSSVNLDAAVEKHSSTNSRNINVDNFEFLLSSNLSSDSLLTADELFFEGKLLPFVQMHQSEKLNSITLNDDDKIPEDDHDLIEIKVNKVNRASNNKPPAAETESRANWFIDDDPSPRPPNCTVLWKELLKLKKQRASLSPSSSSSSSSSRSSLADVVEEGPKESSGTGSYREKYGHHVKRIKKGLERTRSGSIRIRPMVNVAICAQVVKNTNSLPPLFPLKKNSRLER